MDIDSLNKWATYQGLAPGSPAKKKGPRQILKIENGSVIAKTDSTWKRVCRFFTQPDSYKLRAIVDTLRAHINTIEDVSQQTDLEKVIDKINKKIEQRAHSFFKKSEIAPIKPAWVEIRARNTSLRNAHGPDIPEKIWQRLVREHQNSKNFPGIVEAYNQASISAKPMSAEEVKTSLTNKDRADHDILHEESKNIALQKKRCTDLATKQTDLATKQTELNELNKIKKDTIGIPDFLIKKETRERRDYLISQPLENTIKGLENTIKGLEKEIQKFNLEGYDLESQSAEDRFIEINTQLGTIQQRLEEVEKKSEEDARAELITRWAENLIQAAQREEKIQTQEKIQEQTQAMEPVAIETPEDPDIRALIDIIPKGIEPLIETLKKNPSRTLELLPSLILDDKVKLKEKEAIKNLFGPTGIFQRVMNPDREYKEPSGPPVSTVQEDSQKTDAIVDTIRTTKVTDSQYNSIGDGIQRNILEKNGPAIKKALIPPFVTKALDMPKFVLKGMFGAAKQQLVGQINTALQKRQEGRSPVHTMSKEESKALEQTISLFVDKFLFDDKNPSLFNQIKATLELFITFQQGKATEEELVSNGIVPLAKAAIGILQKKLEPEAATAELKSVIGAILTEKKMS